MRAARLVAFLALAVSASGETQDPIEQAFARLYRFDFAGAHETLDNYALARPEDPMGPAVRAAVYLFYELDRLGILEAEFFADDERLTDTRKKMKPDPMVREKFFQAVKSAQSRALATLEREPNDLNSLYALCTTHGVLVDYAALVDRKTFGSLSLAKQSNGCAQRLLRAHPQIYDAYITTGFTEYLAGSLPFFVRWFVRFENVQGSKQEAIRILHEAAERGRYLGPFARILLSLIYFREKKFEESHQMLAAFAKDYPENPLVRHELARLEKRLAGGPVGQR